MKRTSISKIHIIHTKYKLHLEKGGKEVMKIFILINILLLFFDITAKLIFNVETKLIQGILISVLY